MQPFVYISSDHTGRSLAKELANHLNSEYSVEIIGEDVYSPTDDYPIFAQLMAKAVLAHPGSKGILICGSAQGVSVAANKFDGIRAGIGFSILAAVNGRRDDDLNILCLPANIPVSDQPLEIVRGFLNTEFKGVARYNRRLKEISEIETSN
mgnify:CR=1 FL=1